MWKFFSKWFSQKETVDSSMKYLIIGLGNMGSEYEHTRHNIGFDVVDKLAELEEVSFKNEVLGDLAHFKHKGRMVYLLKPSTFMNLSGKATRYWTQKLKIASNQWLVVVDEFQFDLGTIKLQKKGGPGGHNGLKSVEAMMQSSVYPRLRVGIGHDFRRGGQVDYVLGRWTDEQAKTIEKVKEEACKVLKSFVAIGLDRAMTMYNRK
ncbi:MAG: aminoacyl-tRNA hydrolase [Saprospiraceae bacterium]|nr:aminoacyl-tRNA hydrolase [Saprospiraceae bacterium]